MEETRRPNAFHRIFHRFLMLPPVTAMMPRFLHRADAFLWKLNGGRFSLTGTLAGLPTFQVTTIGARSKCARLLPLVGLPDGEKIVLIASNFGAAHHPAWYYNLKANPVCHMSWNRNSRTYVAREADGEERERYWRLAVSFYRGYESYRIMAGTRRIPVMVLEPGK